MSTSASAIAQTCPSFFVVSAASPLICTLQQARPKGPPPRPLASTSPNEWPELSPAFASLLLSTLPSPSLAPPLAIGQAIATAA